VGDEVLIDYYDAVKVGDELVVNVSEALAVRVEIPNAAAEMPIEDKE
jgi:hypothetical protein